MSCQTCLLFRDTICSLGSLSSRTTEKSPQSPNLLSADSEPHKRIFARFMPRPIRMQGAETNKPWLELGLQFPGFYGVWHQWEAGPRQRSWRSWHLELILLWGERTRWLLQQKSLDLITSDFLRECHAPFSEMQQLFRIGTLLCWSFIFTFGRTAVWYTSTQLLGIGAVFLDQEVINDYLVVRGDYNCNVFRRTASILPGRDEPAILLIVWGWWSGAGETHPTHSQNEPRWTEPGKSQCWLLVSHRTPAAVS